MLNEPHVLLREESAKKMKVKEEISKSKIRSGVLMNKDDDPDRRGCIVALCHW